MNFKIGDIIQWDSDNHYKIIKIYEDGYSGNVELVKLSKTYYGSPYYHIGAVFRFCDFRIAHIVKTMSKNHNHPLTSIFK